MRPPNRDNIFRTRDDDDGGGSCSRCCCCAVRRATAAQLRTAHDSIIKSYSGWTNWHFERTHSETIRPTFMLASPSQHESGRIVQWPRRITNQKRKSAGRGGERWSVNVTNKLSRPPATRQKNPRRLFLCVILSRALLFPKCWVGRFVYVVFFNSIVLHCVAACESIFPIFG